MIREHGSIEKILPTLEGVSKYVIPPDWIPDKVDNDKDEDATTDEEGNDDKDDGEGDGEKQEKEKKIPAYVLARELFHNHEVTTDVELKWKAPQAEELTKFLVEEGGFNAERVKNNIEKLKKVRYCNFSAGLASWL